MKNKPRTLSSVGVERVGFSKAVQALSYVMVMSWAVEMADGENVTTADAIRLLGEPPATLYRYKDAYEAAFPELPIDDCVTLVLARVKDREKTKADLFTIGAMPINLAAFG